MAFVPRAEKHFRTIRIWSVLERISWRCGLSLTTALVCGTPPQTAETSWDPTNTSLTKPDADVWSRNPEKELAYGAQTRRFDGKPKPISVFFSNKPGSPALSAYVQPYRWEDENEDSQLEKAAFSSEHPISYEMLQHWVEQELETPSERKLDFPRVVQKFLMAYARDGYGLPKVRHPSATCVV